MIVHKKFIFIISIFASYKTEIICEKKKYMTYILLYITQKFGPLLTRISAKSVFFSFFFTLFLSLFFSPLSLSLSQKQIESEMLQKLFLLQLKNDEKSDDANFKITWQK